MITVRGYNFIRHVLVSSHRSTGNSQDFLRYTKWISTHWRLEDAAMILKVKLYRILPLVLNIGSAWLGALIRQNHVTIKTMWCARDNKYKSASRLLLLFIYFLFQINCRITCILFKMLNFQIHCDIACIYIFFFSNTEIFLCEDIGLCLYCLFWKIKMRPWTS